MGAFLGIDWSAAARQFFTDPVGSVSEPDFIIQEKGKMSADGERGGVWGVNVLSTYILSKELHSHLQRTPQSLPTTPRVIYVTSARALPRFLPPVPAEDAQLINTPESYDASKYVAELVTSALDWDFAQREGPSVRCLRVDPGVVYTGMFKPFLPLLLEWCMVLTFYISRWLGSTVHTISVENAAIGMTFLTLASYLSLVPACPPAASEKSTQSPAKYVSCITRLGSPRVRVSEVMDWETHGRPASLDIWVGECERVWKEWKKREQEGWIGEQQPEEREKGSGVKTD
ncbi:hypothetical protein QFC19_004568 [Naganishia cerealis]|uniref:Uncharacterized protein n=1 Tax=Naganishia cerealis TaxID=610337 RepID=A0ACC2VVF9_9TREE|nr:hypothetical protein QFC19_004568 [Naganishia cerealis]